MAKRRYAIDEQKIARFQKENRGKGHGKDYKPWLTIQDVPSSGRSSRPFSFKTGRHQHFLSDLETGAFYLFQWSDDVIDLREQFPLDRNVTREIAKEMGVAHPVESSTQTEIVMTTDFLIDVRGGNETRLVARSVKPMEELSKVRVLEKQEIERRYWELQGVDWGIITENEIPKQRVSNLRWLYEMQTLKNQTASYPSYWQDKCECFLALFPDVKNKTIKDFLFWLEGNQNFVAGDALKVLRHLAATKKILLDIDVEFSTSSQVSVISLNQFKSSVKKVA